MMRVACLYFRDEVKLSSVAEIFLRLSPQICLGHHSLFIEIGKCHRLYSEQGFQARCRVILRRLQLQATVAIGVDISEAYLKAKHGCNEIDSLALRTLVELADPFHKDEVLQKNVLAMADAFHHLGLRTLGEFKKIPLSELIARFGAMSLLCMQNLRHESTTPWPFWRPEEIVTEKDDFPYFDFYGELEPVLFKLKEQLDRIYQRLWGRQLRIQKLQVRVFCETNSVNPHPFRHFEFEFVSPQSMTKATLNIVKERLARDFQERPVMTPIEALETKVLVAVPGSAGQRNLLHNHEEQMEQFHAVLAQLGEAHGADRIFQVELTEDRRPEKSWRKIRPKLVPSSMPVLDLSRRIPLRPTRLLSAPLKITISDGCIHMQGKSFKILQWPAFPERISGAWFEDTYQEKKSFERSYYHLQLHEAPDVCVFQDEEDLFYLQGYYG
jgi:hypothetical protein